MSGHATPESEHKISGTRRPDARYRVRAALPPPPPPAAATITAGPLRRLRFNSSRTMAADQATGARDVAAGRGNAGVYLAGARGDRQPRRTCGCRGDRGPSWTGPGRHRCHCATWLAQNATQRRDVCGCARSTGMTAASPSHAMATADAAVVPPSGATQSTAGE